jgi:hypothetical protein
MTVLTIAMYGCLSTSRLSVSISSLRLCFQTLRILASLLFCKGLLGPANVW